MKQTWYQSEGGKLAEMLTILHLPYTLMNLSFLAIGFGLAGVQRWDVLFGVALAYFFGLGVAAHSFDQLPGMGSNYIKHLTTKELWALGLTALLLSVVLGLHWMIELKAWHLLWMIPLQTFFVWAYPNSKFMGGFFHGDGSFAVSFGFIPVMVGYYINTLSFDIIFYPWAIVALLISYIEITLSRYVRDVRKEDVENPVGWRPTIRKYLKKPELALKLLCLMSYSLAAAVIMWS